VADVRVQAGGAHGVGAALNATATITVGGFLQAAIEAIRARETTLDDLQALMVELQTTVGEFERQRAAAASAVDAPGLALATYRWTVAGALGTWIQVLLAVLVMVQTAAAAARTEPPPSPPAIVQQQPDPAQFDRQVDERVDERLREIEEQRQAEHHDHGPGARRQHHRRGADR